MKKITKITLILIVILIIACIIAPIIIKNYKVKQLEEKFYISIDNSLDYYDEYVQTGDVEQIKNIAIELKSCQMSLLEIEKIEDGEKSSYIIGMTVSVLESKYDSLKDVEYLYNGLKFYKEDLYNGAGDGEFLTFVNHNTN